MNVPGAIRRGMQTETMHGNGVDLPYPIAKEISIPPLRAIKKQAGCR